MAPPDQYLMARPVEIVLARSAEPESISRDAEVMVLGRSGYATAVKAKIDFGGDGAAILGPAESTTRILEPQAAGLTRFNTPAARFNLPPITNKGTELVLTGRSKAQMF
jgi:hypothetical protein